MIILANCTIQPKPERVATCSMNDSQLIYTFFRHPQYGLSLEAYLVVLLENRSFSYQYQRLVFERMSDYEYPFTDSDKKILRKISELSPKSIESQFNKKQLRTNVFMEKLAKDQDQLKLLSSYFDRRLGSCLELLKGETVYWKERSSDHPGMLPFKVDANPASVTYFFERQDDGINYQLIVQHNDHRIDLQQKGSEILTNQPCFIKHKGMIYHFDDTTDGPKISPFLRSDKLHIPDKLADKFLESFMLKASRKFHVEYDGFDVSTEPDIREAILSIEHDLTKQPVLQLSFRYDRFVVTAAQDAAMLVALQRSEPGMKLLRFTRDAEFEGTALKNLQMTGLKQVRPSWFLPESETKKTFSIEELVEWVSLNKSSLKDLGITCQSTFEGQQFETSIPKIIHVGVEENSDWFDIKAMVELNGQLIPFIKFRRNILDRNRHFKMPDGKIAILPEAWFAKFSDLFEFGEADDVELRLHKQHQGLLKDHPLFSAEISHGLKEEKKQVYLEHAEEQYELPLELDATLRDYQYRGFNWLCGLASQGLGACLADDMGLGKTIQVISVLLKSSEMGFFNANENLNQSPPQLDLFGNVSHAKGTSLIVMAPSLIYNWENELRKFAPNLHVRKHLGQRRRSDTAFFTGADVILTTYGIVRNDVALLKQIQFNHVVLDESQLIKNARSVSFQAVKQLKAHQRIVLTGTPVENSLTDLWSQLTFLQPGLLGGQKFFRQEFVIPIEQQNDITKLEKLRKIIQPFILRRTKEEVAPELPELTRLTQYCEMSPVHKEYYEKQKSIYRNKILESVSAAGIEKSHLVILRGLSHLRQIAIHPSIIDAEYKGDSAKIDQVLFTLQRLQESGKKVLLFSPFVRHLNIYRKYFEENSIPFSYLTGEIPQAKRSDVLQKFQTQKGFKAFLIQLKTGGSGLNIPEADNVFLLDPWWNPALEEQAIARSHRMGQKSAVFAWRFITKDSIEEKIVQLQERKTRIASDILENVSPFSSISKDELKELFS
jgi:SNF2 family DNA or RNA helicase